MLFAIIFDITWIREINDFLIMYGSSLQRDKPDT